MQNGDQLTGKSHLRKMKNGNTRNDEPIPDSKPYSKPYSKHKYLRAQKIFKFFYLKFG